MYSYTTICIYICIWIIHVCKAWKPHDSEYTFKHILYVSLNDYTHTYVYIHMCIYVYVYTYIYMYIYVAYAYICMHIHTQSNTHIYAYDIR